MRGSRAARLAVGMLLLLTLPRPARPQSTSRATIDARALVAAAVAQTRSPVIYDGSYRRIAYPGGDVPRPEHWTGFRLSPDRIEFWLSRPHRLHERRLFTRGETGWSSTLLYP